MRSCSQLVIDSLLLFFAYVFLVLVFVVNQWKTDKSIIEEKMEIHSSKEYKKKAR